MLPASLRAELEATSGMDTALTSLDPVVDSQQSFDRLPSFKRTPARTGKGLGGPPAGNEENATSLWRPRHSFSSAGPRPPLAERSANIQFSDKFKLFKKPERRLTFETPVVADSTGFSGGEANNAAPRKTFAQATKNTTSFESLRKKAVLPAKFDHLPSSAEAAQVAHALANTDFSLWSSSRLPVIYPSTGAVPMPIKHHAPPSQDGTGVSSDSVNTDDATLDADTLACWCHVQSSQHRDPAPIDTGVVRSLIEQQEADDVDNEPESFAASSHASAAIPEPAWVPAASVALFTLPLQACIHLSRLGVVNPGCILFQPGPVYAPSINLQGGYSMPGASTVIPARATQTSRFGDAAAAPVGKQFYTGMPITTTEDNRGQLCSKATLPFMGSLWLLHQTLQQLFQSMACSCMEAYCS
ncbi:hypothetical protein WJX74_002944 [Apatococcus lobatus]|uniref:Uncharacterized protein n=1 Tax=Apatococcus lobatus TaxID=904363 RepID=A0AAW1QMS9_9CHLO